MRVAVCAVQGAFIEHRRALEALGAEALELRQASDLSRPFDALVLPGGESTVQGKLLRELGLFEPLRAKIQSGLPVLGTCAGLILLAESLVNDDRTHLGTLPVAVRRNAYGRQSDSFCGEYAFAGVGTVPMTFIRAPYIERVGAGCEVLAEVDGNIVAVRSGNQLGLSFHPELDADDRIYRYFLEIIRRNMAH